MTAVWPDPLRGHPFSRSWLAGYVARLVDLLFPPRCAGCGRPGALFCTPCWHRVQPLRGPYCSRCGHPLPSTGSPCPACARLPLAFLDKARAAALYTSPLREAVHALKYRGVARLGLLFGEYMARRLRVAVFDVVVPVPLHPVREARRGYNQATLLAQAIASHWNRPLVLSALARVRETSPQVTLDLLARRANVHAAFACVDPAGIAGRTVLLVDDVMTTGSTLDACAAALKAAGAKRVLGFALARVPYQIADRVPPDHPAVWGAV